MDELHPVLGKGVITMLCSECVTPDLDKTQPELLSADGYGTCQICGHALKRSILLPYYDLSVCRPCRRRMILRRITAAVIDFVMAYTLMAITFLMIGVSARITAFLGVRNPIVESDELINLLGNGMVVILWLTRDGWFKGRSVGRLVCRLRVVDTQSGHPASLMKSVKRNLPTLIPLSPIAIVIDLVRRNSARIGDGWAKTKVIPS